MPASRRSGPFGENPVAVEITAMIDVVMCLCLMFLCMTALRPRESAIDTWLPKDT